MRRQGPTGGEEKHGHGDLDQGLDQRIILCSGFKKLYQPKSSHIFLFSYLASKPSGLGMNAVE